MRVHVGPSTVAGALAVVLALLYGEDQAARISTREGIVLCTMVHELSERTGEEEFKIWRRVREHGGEPLRRWYYASTLDLLAQEMSDAKREAH